MLDCSTTYYTNKMICVVREPLSVIAAMLRLTQTFSNNLKPRQKLHETEPAFVEEFIRERLFEMKRYYSSILEAIDDKKLPIYFVRYEELKDEPYRVMVGVFSFLLGIEEDQVCKSILGQRLQQLCAKEKEKSIFDDSFFNDSSEQLRRNKQKNKTIDCFEDKQISLVKQTLSRELHIFGYANLQTMQNITPGGQSGQADRSSHSSKDGKYKFFHFNSKDYPQIKEDLKVYETFRKHN